MPLRELISRNLHDLRTRTDEQARASLLLETLPVREWPRRIATDHCLQTDGALTDILDRATRELYRNAKTGLRVIDAVLALPIDDVVIRARALRLRATALHLRGDGTAARQAIGDALLVLGEDPAATLERLHARLYLAYLRNETAEIDVSLEVKLIAKAFAQHGDAKGALHARLMEATILFDRDDVPRAMAVFKDAVRIAEGLGDDLQQAIALANLGHCAQQLAARAHEQGTELRARAYAEEALSYFARATPRYAALGMDAESQKIVWAIAGIAKQRGNLHEAREQLLTVREDLLQRGMFLAAALVALDLMELLVMLNRQDLVRDWYNEVEETFTRAGMPRYAIDALQHIHQVAVEQPIDAPLLASVRATVRERFRTAA